MSLLFWLVRALTIAFWASAKTTTAQMTIERQECTNGQFTLDCETDKNVNAIQDIEWEIEFNDIKLFKFSSCSNNSRVFNCSQTATLPVGLTLLNNSNGAVTIERSSNASHDHAQIKCKVHYFDISPSLRVYEINFTAQCVTIQEGRDLNLTKILLENALPCGQIKDIEWFSINGSRFAHCWSYQNCSVDRQCPVPVYWKRLQVRDGSLFWTGIQMDDNDQKIKVNIHYKPCKKKAKRDTSIEKAQVYTIWIFVKSGRESPGPNTTPPHSILPTSRTYKSSPPPSSKSPCDVDVSTAINTLPTGSPTRSGALALCTRGQLWAALVTAATVYLRTKQR